MLLTQVIAYVLTAAFVAHEHFVTALATPSDAVQQGSSVAWDAAALGAQVLSPVVAQHDLYLLEGVPPNVGWIFVLHHDPPVPCRPRRLLWPSARRCLLTCSTVDEGAGIGRILQHIGHRRNARPPPAYFAVPITARHC